MDLAKMKEGIVVNVYHIDAEKKVPLHKHPDKDELFYCIGGSGHGVTENQEIDLTTGKVFIVPAGTMHSLKTNENLYVASFLIPAITA